LAVEDFAALSSQDESLIIEMAKAGVLYGHKKSRKNPSFEKYVFTTRNGVEVIDLSLTLKAIDEISQFIKKSLEERKSFLIIGTQPAARESIINLAGALGGSSYVVNKWIGGLITNFSVLYKRIEYYKKRKKDLQEKRFEGYTKKEKLLISREVEKMGERFLGLEEYTKIPDIVFVIDSSLKGHKTVIREAQKKKITLVGIIDNDDNPREFDYLIPANDHSKPSINWVVSKIIEKIK